jgi:hypothetical protein
MNGAVLKLHVMNWLNNGVKHFISIALKTLYSFSNHILVGINPHQYFIVVEPTGNS